MRVGSATVVRMARCETCGNEYDKAFGITMPGERDAHVFDSFE